MPKNGAIENERATYSTSDTALSAAQKAGQHLSAEAQACQGYPSAAIARGAQDSSPSAAQSSVGETVVEGGKLASSSSSSSSSSAAAAADVPGSVESVSASRPANGGKGLPESERIFAGLPIDASSAATGSDKPTEGVAGSVFVDQGVPSGGPVPNSDNSTFGDAPAYGTQSSKSPGYIDVPAYVPPMKVRLAYGDWTKGLVIPGQQYDPSEAIQEGGPYGPDVNTRVIPVAELEKQFPLDGESLPTKGMPGFAHKDGAINSMGSAQGGYVDLSPPAYK